MNHHSSSARRRALASTLLVGCAALAACGGSASGAADAVESGASAQSALSIAPPLVRYATRERVAYEELVAGPYTLVIDADDEAAVESGMQLAETVHTYTGGKTLLGIFVRSRDLALAVRLAERLTQEQGWEHVFVVR